MADTLTGILQRITFTSREDGNDYKIAKLQTGETIKGNAPDSEFIVGQSYTLQGTWKIGKEWQGRREREFHFTKFTRAEPHSRIGLVHYLEKFCPGIGPTIAGRIFDHYGQDAVKALRTSPAEVAEKIKGLTLETAEEASKELQKNVKFEEIRIELEQLFQGKQFSRQLTSMVLKRWGVTAAARIKRDPFCLLVAGFPSCGFNRCDRLYTELGKKPHRLKRLMLFIWHSIRESMDGHTWHDGRLIVQKLRQQAVSLEDTGRDAGQSAERRIFRAVELGVRAGWLAVRKLPDGIWIADGQAAANEDRVIEEVTRIVQYSEFELRKAEEILAERVAMEAQELEEEREERREALLLSGRGGEELSELTESEVSGNGQLTEEQKAEKARLGRETGICQFCSRELTHPESKRRGYGPTCSAKHGLPWGEFNDADSDVIVWEESEQEQQELMA